VLTGGDAWNPVWSPDGHKIVFLGTSNQDTSQLFVMDAQGGQRRALTHGAGYDESSPVWSADGSYIAFTREKITQGQHSSAVFTIRTDGAGTKNISGWATDKEYRTPSWSPDGRRLVYEQHKAGSPPSLIIKNLENGQTKKLVDLSDDTPSEVSWSPSGKKILYTDSFDEVYTIWPDGSHRSVISDGDSYQASWSPDGKRIAFLEDFDGENISISGEDGSVSWLPIHKEGVQQIGSPSWSPDGTKLVFTMTYGAADQQTSGIFSVDVRTQGLTMLTNGEARNFNWQAKSKL
jgi:Tol biopolymer transport system component